MMLEAREYPRSLALPFFDACFVSATCESDFGYELVIVWFSECLGICASADNPMYTAQRELIAYSDYSVV